MTYTFCISKLGLFDLTGFIVIGLHRYWNKKVFGKDYFPQNTKNDDKCF